MKLITNYNYEFQFGEVKYSDIKSVIDIICSKYNLNEDDIIIYAYNYSDADDYYRVITISVKDEKECTDSELDLINKYNAFKEVYEQRTRLLKSLQSKLVGCRNIINVDILSDKYTATYTNEFKNEIRELIKVLEADELLLVNQINDMVKEVPVILEEYTLTPSGDFTKSIDLNDEIINY